MEGLISPSVIFEHLTSQERHQLNGIDSRVGQWLHNCFLNNPKITQYVYSVLNFTIKNLSKEIAEKFAEITAETNQGITQLLFRAFEAQVNKSNLQYTTPLLPAVPYFNNDCIPFLPHNGITNTAELLEVVNEEFRQEAFDFRVELANLEEEEEEVAVVSVKPSSPKRLHSDCSAIPPLKRCKSEPEHTDLFKELCG